MKTVPLTYLVSHMLGHSNKHTVQAELAGAWPTHHSVHAACIAAERMLRAACGWVARAKHCTHAASTLYVGALQHRAHAASNLWVNDQDNVMHACCKQTIHTCMLRAQEQCNAHMLQTPG
eukprot:1141692-Pelagomonas_calceolata.AAC.1